MTNRQLGRYQVNGINYRLAIAHRLFGTPGDVPKVEDDRGRISEAATDDEEVD